MDVSRRLHGQTLAQVESRLGELLTKSRARYALIVDLRGFVLLHLHARGAPEPPPLDSLASLIASNYLATAALAKLIGEKGFSELTQQGKEIGAYSEELGDEALLVTVFDASEPLGRVKYLSKKTVEAILAVVSASKEPDPELPLGDHWEETNHSLLDTLLPSSPKSEPEA